MALFTLFMAACNQNTGNKSEQAKQDDPANVSATPASQQENQAAKKTILQNSFHIINILP